MLTRVQITGHAAERYVKRIDETLTVTEALALLEHLAPTATPLRQRTILGQEQWQLHEPKPCVLVVKRDDGYGGAVVVTVLDAPAVPDGEEDPHEGIIQAQLLERRKSRRSRSRRRQA